MKNPESFRKGCARLAAIALLAAAGAAPAAAQPPHTVDGGGGLYLTTVAGRTTLREPSGEISPVAVPEGGSIRRLVHLDRGWLGAGAVDVPGGSDLYLLRSLSGDREILPAPPNPGADLQRGWPVPLVDGGQLVGLAWLAGSRIEDSAVYASSWSGSDWSEPVTVSPPGPGSQIALAGATLADGSWLLLWSAYDGEDTEVLWSRRQADGWSAPAPLDGPNREPDELPAVIATGRGALAAWSRLDGSDYRIRLARFESGAWGPLDHLGPPGSAYPSFQASPDGAVLLYRTFSPYGWTLLELHERGTVLRRAEVPSLSTWRPALRPTRGGLEVEWLERGSATRPRREAVVWRDEP